METAVKQKDRISYLDALKGFAILCVVLGHIGNGYMWDENASPVFFVIYNITNVFHMPLFIMLSGIVFQKAYLGSASDPIRKGRIAQQVLNLTILYVFWSLILGIFKMIFGGIVNNPVTWQTIALIPIRPIQLYWYLFVLIIFYVVFGLIGAAKWNIYAVFAVTLALNLASSLLPENSWFDIRRVLFYAFFFFLGISMTRFEELAQKKTIRTVFRILVLLLAALGILLSVLFWDREIFLNNRFIVNTVAGLGLSLGLYFCFKHIRFLGESRLLVWFGRHCLEIYLLHTFILTAVRALLQKVGLEIPLVQVLAGLLAGVFLPLLFSWLTKKIRLYNFFFAPYRFISGLKKDKKA